MKLLSILKNVENLGTLVKEEVLSNQLYKNRRTERSTDTTETNTRAARSR